MYATVPTVLPGLVRCSSLREAVASMPTGCGLGLTTFAKPKSMTFACGRCQERNDIGPGLSAYRDGVHGSAVDHGGTADRARLYACPTEKQLTRTKSN